MQKIEIQAYFTQAEATFYNGLFCFLEEFLEAKQQEVASVTFVLQGNLSKQESRILLDLAARQALSIQGIVLGAFDNFSDEEDDE